MTVFENGPEDPIDIKETAMFASLFWAYTHINRKQAAKFGNGLLITVVAVALVTIAALTVRLALASTALVRSDRAVEAEAARWTGLAEASAERDARRERALAADAARWTGLAQLYVEQAADSRAEAAAQNLACPFTAEDRFTLQAVYVEEAGVWLARTDTGYAGHEGGLLALSGCQQ
jgi:hypothetical protein